MEKFSVMSRSRSQGTEVTTVTGAFSLLLLVGVAAAWSNRRAKRWRRAKR